MSEPVGQELALRPPRAAPAVRTEQADPETSTVVPVSDETEEQATAIARQWVAELSGLTPRSPRFQDKVREIESVARDESKAVSQSTSRMLERPVAALDGARGTGGTVQARAAGSLAELRLQVERLAPSSAGLSRPRKLLGVIPFGAGDKITAYFERYRSAQSQLDAILRALTAAQDELTKDSAAIEVEKVRLWELMEVLARNAVLLAAAARELQGLIDRTPDDDSKTALTSDALFAAQQRRQDVLTLLAVSMQGHLAFGMLQDNNAELIKGIERAQTTTLVALRTAIIVSQALSSQALVLNQISGINATTSDLISASTSLLSSQEVAVQQQADSTAGLAKLQEAFDSTFAAMDAVDRLRAGAAVELGKTVEVLEGQVERAKPYLQRVVDDRQNG
ncbi:MAG: toxic anion resistance protein [Micrococcales bacterium]|nr:toxic anion resistance protein [Micrococcales bacterium]